MIYHKLRKLTRLKKKYMIISDNIQRRTKCLHSRTYNSVTIKTLNGMYDVMVNTKSDRTWIWVTKNLIKKIPHFCNLDKQP